MSWGRSGSASGHSVRAMCAALAVMCLGLLTYQPALAQGAESYLFDPVLSLSGTCDTEVTDQVPDPWCPGPPAPSAPFENPSITIDSFGNMYVSSHKEMESGGRVDVFDPQGEFITEVAVNGARALAVDADGNLYVAQFVVGGLAQVSRFVPTLYNPAQGEIEYGDPGVVVVETAPPGLCGEAQLSSTTGVAVDPTTGHLFVSPGRCVGEYSSKAEGNEPLDLNIGQGVLTEFSTYLAIDPVLNRLYVVDATEAATKGVIEVFDLEDPHAYLGRLDGSDTPAGKFLSGAGDLTLDVNVETGHLFVSDVRGAKKVYEMGPGYGVAEEHLATFEHEFKFVKPGEIAVDNSPVSPNQGSFYVPSGSAGGGIHHTYAFKLVESAPPVVESVSVTGVTASEVVLRARVNPEGESTKYRFEYTSVGDVAFSGAVTVGEGTLPAGVEGIDVSAPVTGLTPGTQYRFRVVAENNAGKGAREGVFRTYLDLPVGGPCPNEAFRTSYSANLPDCRAYELVTPPDTNGHSPLGSGRAGVYFPTLHASPDGTKATFRIEGGSLPGTEASGSFNGDNYLARRGATGWFTEYAGPSGTDALAPQPGSFSPDQEHSFWNGEDRSTSTPTENPHIRYPDGHSEPVGRGTLGVDSRVNAKLISQGASHIIFATSNLTRPAIQLEPNAPPAGTTAIYDRTADRVTHVVSLLPGEITPAAGENAFYVGASLDGEGVAFEIGESAGETLYFRQDNQATYEVGGDVTFAGIAEGGGRVFYLQAGNLFALDTASGKRIQFGKGGDITPVNVSPDGTTAYFISPDVLSAKTTNPNGDTAEAGGENLYISREGIVSFIGTVDPLDVKEPFGGSGQFKGLGMWVKSQQQGLPAIATSRTTPDGRVLLFESRAPLGDYDPEGHIQIYRYDSRAPSLTCLSCNPIEAPATGDASLQTIPSNEEFILGLPDRMLNLRPDGNRAFFQSFEALVPSDVDGRKDVYEWEAQGVGSCTQAVGCVYLISSGRSADDEHLFAASESGDDVFFLSPEILLPADKDRTPSIYDARVGGGFPESEGSSVCQGEGCRGPLTPPPSLATPSTPPTGASGKPARRPCPKGKRKVRRKGKVRCVKKHRQHKRQHNRNQKQRRTATNGS